MQLLPDPSYLYITSAFFLSDHNCMWPIFSSPFIYAPYAVNCLIHHHETYAVYRFASFVISGLHIIFVLLSMYRDRMH